MSRTPTTTTAKAFKELRQRFDAKEIALRIGISESHIYTILREGKCTQTQELAARYVLSTLNGNGGCRTLTYYLLVPQAQKDIVAKFLPAVAADQKTLILDFKGTTADNYLMTAKVLKDKREVADAFFAALGIEVGKFVEAGE